MSIQIHEKWFTLPELQAEAVFDLTALIRMAIRTSGEHDQRVQAELGLSLVTEGQTWVVTQYKLQVHAICDVQQPMRVTTCVVEANRFFVNRRFRVWQGATLLAVIEAQYVVLDLVKRRMCRIESERLEAMDLLVKEAPVKFELLKCQTPPLEQRRYTQVIQPYEIDENHHVNNLVYVKWCQAQLEATSTLTQASVKYGSELLPEDEVVIETTIYQLSAEQWLSHHDIHNVTKDKLACTVQMMWQTPVYLK